MRMQTESRARGAGRSTSATSKRTIALTLALAHRFKGTPLAVDALLPSARWMQQRRLGASIAAAPAHDLIG